MTQPEQLRQAFEKLARMMPKQVCLYRNVFEVKNSDKNVIAVNFYDIISSDDIHATISLLGVSVWIVPQDSITDDEQEQICSLEAQFYTINNHRFIDNYEIDVRPPFDYHEALLEAFCKYVEQLPEEVKQ